MSIDAYRNYLHLQDAAFVQIVHEEAMVASVFKVTLSSGDERILKIEARKHDALREAHFLKHFAGKLPVPRLLQMVEPQEGLKGALLLEFLPGRLLTVEDLSEKLAYEIGSKLACIHQSRLPAFGDPIFTQELRPNPHYWFCRKFEEGFAECRDHLPRQLLDKVQRYFEENCRLLDAVDGPCMVHRDFRPGNLLVLDGKLTGIIDWTAGRAGFAEEDFCPLEQGEWPIKASQKEAFLAGYASTRPVPDYRQLMPLLFVNRAIAVVGFTVKQNSWNTTHAALYQKFRRFLDAFT